MLSQIYMGIGMPHLHRRYVVVLSGSIICLIYPAIKLFGLAGSAGVLLFADFLALALLGIWVSE